jgi:hypothetical protein
LTKTRLLLISVLARSPVSVIVPLSSHYTGPEVAGIDIMRGPG